MKYLDANVFVHAALGVGRAAARAQDLLRSVAAGEEEAATASLTIDEVVWKLWHLVDRASALSQGERLVGLATLKVLEVRRDHVAHALELMNRHSKLRPRDAIHVAVAVSAGCRTIVSNDRGLDGLPLIGREPIG